MNDFYYRTLRSIATGFDRLAGIAERTDPVTLSLLSVMLISGGTMLITRLRSILWDIAYNEGVRTGKILAQSDAEKGFAAFLAKHDAKTREEDASECREQE